MPLHIYSDNGKNFVGASSELRDLGNFLVSQADCIKEHVSNQGCSWHFIPPHSPHFGGIWEAGIKSCKHHLKRVLGNTVLTYEEFSTLLSQVESIMNSRPISKLSMDPSDPQPLTPAHFLIGRTLTALPEPDLSGTAESRLPNFQKIQKMLQALWRRWSKEYISELQQRTKWYHHQADLKLGAIVLLKDDQQPPLRWKLGKIIKVYPGADGINRVAEVKTETNTVKRAFSKICPLPTD